MKGVTPLILIWMLFVHLSAEAKPFPFPVAGMVQLDDVQLTYLDYGGNGPVMIIVPGLVGSPHGYDGLAREFTDRYHVMTYARRGSPGSDSDGPFDNDTLTADLQGLMNALKIDRAVLVGSSAGGNEVTELAAREPKRVQRIVYLDSGYDWGDPNFTTAVAAYPVSLFDIPSSAAVSLDAYRKFKIGVSASDFAKGDFDLAKEATLRDNIAIQADGSIRPRTPRKVIDALYEALKHNRPRAYSAVRCPVLAIYSQHLFDVSASPPRLRDKFAAFERDHWRPYRAKSMRLVQREIRDIRIVEVGGTHFDVMNVSHGQVIAEMRSFLEVASRASSSAVLDDAQSAIAASATVGQKFRDCAHCPEMIVIPAGQFTMTHKGAADGQDDLLTELIINPKSPVLAHEVRIHQPFAVGLYAVTRDEYSTFVHETSRESREGCYLWNAEQWTEGPDRNWRHPGFSQSGRDPVVCVNWEDAQAYTRWLNRTVRNHSFEGPYRLPTQEESEYAAGAGAKTLYYWGDAPSRKRANYGADDCYPCRRPARSGRDRWHYTSPVGSFPPNAFGLYDMAGNVWQWTDTCRPANYPPQLSCKFGAVRGGGWLDYPQYIRIGEYNVLNRLNRNNATGFRVVRDLEQEDP